ncbi:hypothetical protein [Komagataeibacter medellinensis]|uniref:hypothetical protein n=1 Tax=Komagataeibacter medellinensis TaxID=1177712 RepID=UPI0012954428|nr:hypothetical protein [Komagataeibacter medellinensis]
MPDPYASVRRLEPPLLLHMSKDIRAHIHPVEQGRPMAAIPSRPRRMADLKRLE